VDTDRLGDIDQPGSAALSHTTSATERVSRIAAQKER